MVKSFLEVAKQRGIAKGKAEALKEVMQCLIDRGMSQEQAAAITDISSHEAHEAKEALP